MYVQFYILRKRNISSIERTNCYSKQKNLCRIPNFNVKNEILLLQRKSQQTPSAILLLLFDQAQLRIPKSESNFLMYLLKTATKLEASNYYCPYQNAPL